MTSRRPKKVPGDYPKTVTDMKLSARRLDKMIEEATVDCYDESEQTSGFYTMIEDHLAVPFVTEVLGVEVSVVGIEMDENGSLKAVCERNRKRQLIGLIDLELPKSPPSGAEWIAAYRHWLRGR
jgi:Calcium binding